MGRRLAPDAREHLALWLQLGARIWLFAGVVAIEYLAAVDRLEYCAYPLIPWIACEALTFYVRKFM